MLSTYIKIAFVLWRIEFPHLWFFAVTVEGKVYACGEATNGRLGLGLSSGTVPIPRQITALSSYVVKKVAVHSGKVLVPVNLLFSERKLLRPVNNFP